MRIKPSSPDDNDKKVIVFDLLASAIGLIEDTEPQAWSESERQLIIRAHDILQDAMLEMNPGMPLRCRYFDGAWRYTVTS